MTTEQREVELATALGEDTDLGVAPLSEEASLCLGEIIKERDWRLTTLSKEMGMSHTWLLRKIGDDKTNSRVCTVADAVKILEFLGLETTELTDRLGRRP